MVDETEQKQSGQLPTNLRLVRLVEEVARAGVPLSPTVIGRALGLPKPTVHRLLNTAEAEGLLQRHLDGKSFGPGRRLRRLAINTLSSERMRTERLAILRKLATEVGETCNISVPGRGGMVYLERVETHWPLRIQMPIGTQVPFHCTASGKMYLSTLRPDRLDRILRTFDLPAKTERSLTSVSDLKEDLGATRSRGYSTDNEEFIDGMAAIALPINDDQGRLLSTLSVHAPLQRHSVEALEQFLDALQGAATQLEQLALD